jgi:hypothetical protein
VIEPDEISKFKNRKYLRVLILEIILMIVICAAIILITKFIF